MTYDIMIKVISMNIDMNVGISNRHVHLTEDDFKKLFNNNYIVFFHIIYVYFYLQTLLPP